MIDILNFSLDMPEMNPAEAEDWAALFDKLAGVARAGEFAKATKVRARLESEKDWTVVVEERAANYREF